MLKSIVPPVPGSNSVSHAPLQPVIAIIPARYASTRLPGKALLDLAGKPLIEHVYRRTDASRSVDRVLVATDDERIKRAVEAFGGTAVMTSAAHPSGTDRLAEVAASIECAIVVNVQGDEPLIEPGMIDAVVGAFATDPSVQMATLRRRIEHPAEQADPNVTKVVVDRDGYALYFSRAAIPFRRDPHHDPAPAFKHVGLYAYRRSCLLALAGLPPAPLERSESLEQLRALEHGYRIKVIETRYDSIGVDTPEDLERVRLVLAGARA